MEQNGGGDGAADAIVLVITVFITVPDLAMGCLVFSIQLPPYPVTQDLTGSIFEPVIDTRGPCHLSGIQDAPAAYPTVQ